MENSSPTDSHVFYLAQCADHPMLCAERATSHTAGRAGAAPVGATKKRRGRPMILVEQWKPVGEKVLGCTSTANPQRGTVAEYIVARLTRNSTAIDQLQLSR